MSTASSATITEDILREDSLLVASGFIVSYGLDIPRPISIKEINSAFFVKLFGKVFNYEVPDLISPVLAVEDEVHNLQALIDTLSLDILNMSLSHITGEDIMTGDVHVIHNLLEVFEGYVTYCCALSESQLTSGREEQEIPPLSEEFPEQGPSLHICGFCGHQREPSDEQRASTLRGMETYGPDAFKTCPICSNVVRASNLPLDAEQLQKLLSLSIPSRDDQLSKQRTGSSEKTSSSSSTLKPLQTAAKPQKKLPTTGLFTHSSPEAADSDVQNRQDLMSSVVDEQLSDYEETRPKTRYYTRLMKEQTESPSQDRPGSLYQVPLEMIENKATQTSRVPKKGQGIDEPDDVVDAAKQIPVPVDEIDMLKEMYAQNFEAKVADFLTDKTQHRRRATDIKKVYLKSLKKPYCKPQSPLCKKSFLLPCPLRHRGRSTPLKPGYKPSWNKKLGVSDERKFLEELDDLLPNACMSVTAQQRMSQQYRRHLVLMHKNLKECLSAKTRTQKMTEEAMKRQQMVNDMLRKELERKQRRSDMLMAQSLQRQLRSSHRDARISSAKVHQHLQEFCVDSEKKFDQVRDREQQMMQNLMKDRMQLEQAQVRRLIRSKNERDREDGENFGTCREDLSNFYQSQLNRVADSLAAEQSDMDSRNEGQRRAMDAMTRERRNRALRDIRDGQADMRRTNEDILHFRELDAQQFRDRMADRLSDFSSAVRAGRRT